MRKRILAFDGALDLRRTLRHLGGAFADDGWWLATRTQDGPGSLRVTRDREGIVGHAWGPGADWLLHRLGDVVGLGDDPSEFQPTNSLVAELHRRHPGMRFGRTSRVFDPLLTAVCGQKVTGTEAARAVRGLYRLFSDPAPGPNPALRLPPDPGRMAAAPYYEYHDSHLEKRRAEVLRALAANAERLEALALTTPSEAAETLLAYPGVGPWTVAKTLAVSHGDPDQVPVGDFHLKHLVVHHLTGRDRGTDEEMLELLEPFRPHRGRVTRLLHTMGHAPRFGPRMAPRNLTRY